VVYLTALFVIRIQITPNDYIIARNYLQNVWKELAVAQFKALSRHLLTGRSDFHFLVTSAKLGGDGQLYHLAALPTGINPWYPLNRRRGGPRADLDALEKRKTNGACQE
jgi:hypothetical protein